LVQFFFEDSPFSHDSDWESVIEDDDVNDILLMMVPIKNLHVEVHRRRKQRGSTVSHLCTPRNIALHNEMLMNGYSPRNQSNLPSY
jgi:hypothetical protein